MQTAQTLLMVGQIYLWIGVAVAVVFLFWGLDRIDHKGPGAWAFRPLLVPGILLIWPMVLLRWWVLERGQENLQNRHRPPMVRQRFTGLLLSLVIAVVVIGALFLRQNGPFERPAELLAPPMETSQQ